LPADVKAGLAENVRLLAQAVAQSSGADADGREWARRLARVLEQHEAMLRLGAFSPTVPRDEALAENTLWVLDRLAPGGRAVFWAHNAHVQRVPAQGPAIPAGSAELSGLRLSRALGEQYYAIATAYGGPSMEDATRPAGDSVDGTFELVSTQPFLLSLRMPSRPPAVESWLTQPRLMRFQTGYLSVPLVPAFDAVAYFDRGAPAVRVTGGR
jgi:erythromycin esterase-like protein